MEMYLDMLHVNYRTSSSTSGATGRTLPSGRSDNIVQGFVETAFVVVLGFNNLEEGTFYAQPGYRVQFAIGTNESIRQRRDLIERFALASDATLNVGNFAYIAYIIDDIYVVA